MNDELKARLGLDRTGFDSGLEGARSAVDGFRSILLEAATALGLAFSVDRVVDFAKEAVASAGEAQDAMQALAASLGRAGVEAPKAAAKELYNFANQLQSVSRYDDDVIESAMAMGASMGFTGDKLKEVTRHALDMAQATGMTVQNAIMRFVQAMETGSLMLGRTSIKLDQAKMSADAFGTVMAAVNAHFGGAASEMAETYAGRLDQVKNEWGDLMKQFGYAVTDSKLLNAAFVEATQALGTMQTYVQRNRDAMVDWVERGFLYLFGALETVTSLAFYAVVALRGVQVAGSFVIAGFAEVATKAKQGFSFVAMAGAEAWAKIIDGIDDVQNAIDAVAEKLIGFGSGFAKHLGIDLDPLVANLKAGDAVLDTLRASADETADDMKAHWADVPAVFQTLEESAFEVAQEELDSMNATSDARKKAIAVLEEYRQKMQQLAGTIQVTGGVTVTPGGIPAPGYHGPNQGAKQQLEDLRKELDQTDASAKQFGNDFGAAFGEIVTGSLSARDAVKRMAVEMLRAVQEYVTKSMLLHQQAAVSAATSSAATAHAQIMANAATAASGAAASQAGIPFLGPGLAIAAATAMFAFVEAFLTKFATGGEVGGSGSPSAGDSVFALLTPRELVLPAPGRAIDPGLRDAALARLGAGAGGNHYALTIESRDFVSRSDEATERMIKTQAKRAFETLARNHELALAVGAAPA